MINFHSLAVQNRGNLWLIILLACCLSPSFTHAQTAQATQKFAAKTCDTGLKQIDGLKLCVSDNAKKSAFKRLAADKSCSGKYKRFAGLPFCVLNSKEVNLAMKGDYFVLKKSEKKNCRTGFNRAPSAKFCIDKRLALSAKRGKLRLSPMPVVACSASDVNNSVCKQVCAPGYLRSPSYDMCVAFKLAKRGHRDLKNPDKSCGGSSYWSTRSDRGLCLPRLVFNPASTAQVEVIAANGGGGGCNSGQRPQVVHVAIGSSQANATDSLVAPMVMCSPPGRIKQLD